MKIDVKSQFTDKKKSQIAEVQIRDHGKWLGPLLLMAYKQ